MSPDAAAVEEQVAEQQEAEEVVVDRVVTTQHNANLKCKLKKDEIVRLAMAMGDSYKGLRSLKEEAKASATDYKSQIAALEKDLEETSGSIREGYVFREVEVQRTVDYEKGTVTEMRLDSGDVMIKRGLSEAEKQMPLLGTTQPEESEEATDPSDPDEAEESAGEEEEVADDGDVIEGDGEPDETEDEQE